MTQATHDPLESDGITANKMGDTKMRMTVTAFAHVAMALGSTGMRFYSIRPALLILRRGRGRWHR